MQGKYFLKFFFFFVGGVSTFKLAYKQLHQLELQPSNVMRTLLSLHLSTGGQTFSFFLLFANIRGEMLSDCPVVFDDQVH